MMSKPTWYRIEVNEECVLGGAYHRLCRAFQRIFIGAGAPPDMALLAEMHPFHNRRLVYLSPASIPHVWDLIAEYSGTPCDPPDLTHVSVVFGVPDVKMRLGDLEDELFADLVGAVNNIIPLTPFDEGTSFRAATGT